MDILLNRFVLYYVENPRLFCCHAEIYKLLEDVIIEIAKRSKPYKQKDQLGKALEDLLKKILRRRVCKRNVDLTVGRDFKRSKIRNFL